MTRYSPLAAVTLLLLATPVFGQRPDRDDAPCETTPSIGITGLSCENCSFSFASSRRQASFRTEPRILGVRRDGPSAGLLRPGDAIVSIDGHLITTRRGGDAFSDFEAGDIVRMTVRRDGREREVSIEADQACRPAPPAPPAPRAGAIPPRPPSVAPAPSPATSVAPTPAPRALPEPPSAPAAPEPRPAPTPPEPAPLSDLAADWMSLSAGLRSIGFTLQCNDCGLTTSDAGATLLLAQPPQVRSVVAGGLAERAGLRAGDVIVEVDGLSVVTPRGGERLARLEPGRSVRLGVERSGRMLDIELDLPRPPRPPTPTPGVEPRPAPPVPAGSPGPLRQVSRLGDVDIEVRGESAVYIEEGDVVIIRSGDLEVRLRRRSAGGRIPRLDRE